MKYEWGISLLSLNSSKYNPMMFSNKNIVNKPIEIREKLGFNVDYSNDWEYLKKLKNIIIPKSNDVIQTECINYLIKYNSSEKMQLILVDNNTINFNIYNELPNMLVPVIYDAKKLESAIEWACAEMQERTFKFMELNARDIFSYNSKTYFKMINCLPIIIIAISEIYGLNFDTNKNFTNILLDSGRRGIYIVLFSKFDLKFLSLGVNSNLLEIYTNEQLNQLITGRNIIKDVIENFDYMEGHDFEYYCASLLRKNGYDGVEVTQGSGDQGIDIIAYQNGVKYGIQCKCYSSDIGNKAVQEAYSGAKFYDCHVPVVLTNRYFTPSARELAKKTNVLLWDRDELERLVGRG